MSIIERDNPLNLQFQVCVVTSAGSPLGVVVCKTLLKANAFVLGVDDTNPKHETLNAGLGTHFQFLKCNVNDSDAPKRIIETAREAYGLERVDALVNVMLEPGNESKVLTEAVAQVMLEQHPGSIVNIGKSAADRTKSLAAQYGDKGIRCNAIVPGGQNGSGNVMEMYAKAKEHMTAMIKSEKKPGPAQAVDPRLYEIGNLTLFLVGGMSESVSGAIVAVEGVS